VGNLVLHCDDCLNALAEFSADSIDSIVTDSPYGLNFMGKDWDHGVPGAHFWQAILRVAKPGAWMLSFGGTRTWHRLAVAIEDAGWEIRDTLMWVYGSGFPKSLDVAMSIDKRAKGHPQGSTKGDPDSPNFGKFKTQATEGKRSISDKGQHFGAGPGAYMLEQGIKYKRDLVATALPWRGWGTALKPAWEPIILARKPLEGTVAENVLKYGTGALNIDGCRVGCDSRPLRVGNYKQTADNVYAGRQNSSLMGGSLAVGETSLGRWSANLIHDGSEEILECFPEAKGQQGDLVNHNRTAQSPNKIFGVFGPKSDALARGDLGSAARFFYCAKASPSERNFGMDGSKNNHPTVKPLALCKYLCRLITPPGGVVLDPFMGSGSIGMAALSEGFKFVGIELEAESFKIAVARCQAMEKQRLEVPGA
jgi:site-specific DNA-methyltransferase (adenine-specific)